MGTCEWVSDWYGMNYYAETSYENPDGPVTGSSRVLRGGSLLSDTNTLRASNRRNRDPDRRYYVNGFRCAH